MALASRCAVLLAVLVVTLGSLGNPAVSSAHAALVSSDPANGATVPAGFAGPIVLTYSEGLRSGSHAELLAAGGAKVADAAIDPANATRMLFTLAAPLEPGAWTIQWTSVAADRDIQRGQVSFTVAAPTASPTAQPTLAPTAAPTLLPTVAPAPSPPLPSPSSSPTPGPTGSTTADVVIPIVVALALVGAAALILLRRRGGPA
jgi:MYXO-CTERM domain-containing protein